MVLTVWSNFGASAILSPMMIRKLKETVNLWKANIRNWKTTWQDTIGPFDYDKQRDEVTDVSSKNVYSGICHHKKPNPHFSSLRKLNLFGACYVLALLHLNTFMSKFVSSYKLTSANRGNDCKSNRWVTNATKIEIFQNTTLKKGYSGLLR